MVASLSMLSVNGRTSSPSCANPFRAGSRPRKKLSRLPRLIIFPEPPGNPKSANSCGTPRTFMPIDPSMPCVAAWTRSAFRSPNAGGPNARPNCRISRIGPEPRLTANPPPSQIAAQGRKIARWFAPWTPLNGSILSVSDRIRADQATAMTMGPARADSVQAARSVRVWSPRPASRPATEMSSSSSGQWMPRRLSS